jgi:hypothetical protein
MLSSNRNLLYLLLGSVLILSKVFFIELDPPKFDIAFYQPVDELYYVTAGYNQFEFNSVFNEDKISVFGSPWLSNLVTFGTLNIFGDNYYGLRMSSIFFSLIFCFLFFSIS